MTKEMIVKPSEEQVNALSAMFPRETSAPQIILPRLGMYSQDKTEGKGKAMKVIAEAGTFYTEKETDEIDPETKKKIWEKTEIDSKEIDVTILYKRHQLRHYDEATEEYTSSSVYDTDDEIIPLFKGKEKIATGTRKELQAPYQFVGKDNKTKDGLEVNTILYVLFNGEMYQMNLRGTSGWSYKDYARKNLPPTLLTTLTPEDMENGSIKWTKINFTTKRQLSEEEVSEVIRHVSDIKEVIAAQKEAYAKAPEQPAIRAEVVEGAGNADDF